MTAKVTVNQGQLILNVNDIEKGFVRISEQELKEIAGLVARVYGNETQDHKSERKQLLSRLSFLEAWKKRSMSNTQRVFANLSNRIHELEITRDGWEEAGYNALKTRLVKLEEMIKTTPAWLNQDEQVLSVRKEIEEVRAVVSGELDSLVSIFNKQRAQLQELEKRLMSDGRKTSLESRMTSLESAVKASPSRLTQDAKITHLENHIEDLNQYIAGELDVITKHLAKTNVSVTELERLDGLHQKFSQNQLERMGATERELVTICKTFQEHLTDLSAEMDNQRSDYHDHIGQLVGDNRTEHKQLEANIQTLAKQVSAEPTTSPAPGSLHEALVNRDKKRAENKKRRDAKGRFK